MQSGETLDYALSFAAILIAGAFAYAIYHTVLILKTLQIVLEDIKDTTRDIQAIKNTLKFGLANFAGKLLQTKTRARR